MITQKAGFSLVEILVGMLIVSFVMVAGFQALSSIGVGKIKLIEKTKIEKEAYFAGEKFFEMVKKGGTIDYEEYWNRQAINMSAGANFVAGHYAKRSGFGNFGRDGNPGGSPINYGWRGYHCRSDNRAGGTEMGTNGCLDDFNDTLLPGSQNLDYSEHPQRFGQYERQFIDRNSDLDADSGGGCAGPGDEDCDGKLEGDSDDSFIAIGPKAFVGSPDENQVTELYLINAEGNRRTFFRWRVEADGDAPGSVSCDLATDPENPTGDGCLGTIEFLQLDGYDYGYDHNPLAQPADDFQGDGQIDTWLIDEDFTAGNSTPIADSSSSEYWRKIFPDTIHVKKAEFYLYPNKSLEYSWRDTDPDIQVSPYVQILLTLEPSWKKRRNIAGSVPSVDVITTIHLSDLDFR